MPFWMREWVNMMAPAGQILLIVVAAWVLQTIGVSFLNRLRVRYRLPVELQVGGRRLLRFIIYTAALLLVLERLGVSGTMLWTAFTGFAAVAAVAFFAAWSVLSNIFCAMLIFTTRLFRLNDHVELLEGSDKPGMRGRVIDINLIFTTLQETPTDVVNVDADTPVSLLRIPNNLFFQRVLRRSPGAAAPPPRQPVPAADT